jgi:hypothetical protein
VADQRHCHRKQRDELSDDFGAFDGALAGHGADGDVIVLSPNVVEPGHARKIN